MPPGNQRPQRPPLTHFLCLPLLTSASTLQLKASLAHLRSVIEAIEPATGQGGASPEAQKQQPQTRPLVPPAAFRPLGTLHLTLGVMSLREAETLQGALKFLEELDLERMLRDVSQRVSNSEEVVPRESAININLDAESSTTPPDEATAESSTEYMTEANQEAAISPDTETTAPKPKSSTLSKLSTPPPFPSQSSTENPPQPSPPLPISPTPQPQQPQQLQPLCITLQGLSPFPPTSPNRATVLHTPPHDPTSRLHPFCLSLLSRFKAAGYISAEDRELTLHATLINTVYAAKNRRGEKKRMGKTTFDASEIMTVFNQEGGQTSSSSSFGRTLGEAFTFKFASSIPVNRVQICAMRAQELDPNNDPDGLGERYIVLAEKMILPPTA